MFQGGLETGQGVVVSAGARDGGELLSWECPGASDLPPVLRTALRSVSNRKHLAALGAQVKRSAFCFFFFKAAPVAHGSSQARVLESELQLPAYTTATAMRDLSCICDLWCSLRQH